MFEFINNLFSALFNIFDNENEIINILEYNSMEKNNSINQLKITKAVDSSVIDDNNENKLSEEQNFDSLFLLLFYNNCLNCFFLYILVDGAFAYLVEYSLHYGLLKLSPIMRQEFGIPVMLVQVKKSNFYK